MKGRGALRTAILWATLGAGLFPASAPARAGTGEVSRVRLESSSTTGPGRAEWALVRLDLQGVRTRTRCLAQELPGGSLLTARHCLPHTANGTFRLRLPVVRHDGSLGGVLYRASPHPSLDVALLIPPERPNAAALSTIAAPSEGSAVFAARVEREVGVIGSATVVATLNEAIIVLGEGSVTHGDSGGPLLVREGNTLRCAGILRSGHTDGRNYAMYQMWSPELVNWLNSSIVGR